MQLIMGLHEDIVVSMADSYHREPKAVRECSRCRRNSTNGWTTLQCQPDGSALVITAGLLDNELWSDDVILARGVPTKRDCQQFTKISWEVRNARLAPGVAPRI
jgi:hypothetical protein